MDWRRKNLERVVDEIKETAYDEGYKAGYERSEKNAGLPTTNRPEILEEAVRVFGAGPQIDMAIEEMSELTKALLKHRRAEAKPEAYEYEKTTQNIYEEMADVIIMLLQIVIIFGGRAEIERHIKEKTDRLARRLKDGKGEEEGSETMNESKSNLEAEIAEIFKDRSQSDSSAASVIYGVLPGRFYQVKTGNLSESRPTIDYWQKINHQSAAADFISGFIWCMEAAGLINDEKRDQMIDELYDLQFSTPEFSA